MAKMLPAPDERRTNPDAGRRAFWIALAGSLVLRLLALTLRLEVQDEARLGQVNESEPLIFAFWHNRLLLIPILWRRFLARRRPRQGMALTSTSRDGEIIAQFLLRFGIGPVRGSATRRGVAALRELAGLLARGHDVAVTPDGSRGPCYELKGGLVALAQLTGHRVVPMSWECTRTWRLPTWDRFIVPRPFSRVTLHLGEPFTVPREAGAQRFEAQRQACEQALMSIVRER